MWRESRAHRDTHGWRLSLFKGSLCEDKFLEAVNSSFAKCGLNVPRQLVTGQDVSVNAATGEAFGKSMRYILCHMEAYIV